MKILVTGGAGFIGSNFIEHILNKYPSYQIVNLDKLTYAGNLENLTEVENNPNYEFIQGDICDKNLVKKAMSDCDYVVNFAAESHVDRSIEDSDAFFNTNILGLRCLLDIAKDFKVKKFLQIGTDEVYGSLTHEDKPSEETDLLKPRSPYAASKASVELMALSYFHTHNLPVVITRSSNNFGFKQHPEKLIPRSITNLIEGEKAFLMGDGSNIRDWIFVLDNCEGLDSVIHNGKIGEIYNIGGNNEKTNKEVLDSILKNLKKDKSSIETIPHRLGHDFRYSLNSNKMEQELNWTPKFEFEDSLEKTVEWYKIRPDYWKKMINKKFVKKE